MLQILNNGFVPFPYEQILFPPAQCLRKPSQQGLSHAVWQHLTQQDL